MGSVIFLFGDKLISKNSLIILLIFITPFTNGENLFFNFNHSIVTLILVFFLFVLNYDKILTHRSLLNHKFKLFITLLISSYFLSIFFGLDYTDNANLLRYDITYQASIRSLIFSIPLHIILIFLIYLSIDSVSDLKKILLSLILCAVFVNFIAFLLLSSGINTITGRIASTYEDPNYLGRLEVISVSLSLCFILYYDLSKFFRNILIVNIIVSVIIQILTFSRSSIITLVGAIFIIMLFHKNKYLKYFIPISVVFGMIFIIPVMSSVRYGISGANTIGFLQTFIDPSNALRIFLNIIAFKMFINNPIFGVGYNNFFNTMLNNSEYFPISLPLITNTSILHSWLFNILAEQGLLGFISFTAIILMFYRRLKYIIIKNYDKNFRFLGISLLALLFIFVFNGLFFPTIIMELIFSILCGLIASFLKIAKTQYLASDNQLKFI